MSTVVLRVLKVLWTVGLLVAVAALVAGLDKTTWFWSRDAQEIEEGRRLIRVASAGLVALGVAAVAVLGARLWTFIPVVAMCAVCTWLVHSDWLPLVGVLVLYPLTGAVLAGWWTARPQALAAPDALVD